MERLQGLQGERGSENLFYTMHIYILTNTVLEISMWDSQFMIR